MRVVALFRVSTERQASEGASLDAQERIFNDLARTHQWNVVATFRGCESASQAGSERQVLQQVLASIRASQPDAIYVHEQSRLTRGDELEVALLMRELRERGVKVIVGGVVRDLASIDERFMISIQSLVDRTESERIRERVNRGKQELSLQGRVSTGRAPYGYRNPPEGDPKRGILQVVPDKAAVVRRIFALSASGMGMARIASMLTAEGIVAPGGSKWHEAQVRAMLYNPVYVGTHCSRVWVQSTTSHSQRRVMDNPRAIVVPNAHEAIIDQATWDMVQLRRNPPAKAPTLLSGLLTLNGRKAAAARQRDFAGYYVRDTRGMPWVRREHMESAVWDALVRLLSRPETIEACIAATERDRNLTDLKSRERQATEQVEKLKRKLERLVDMRAEGELTREEFMERSRDARVALSVAEVALQSVAAEVAGASPEQLRRVIAAARIAVAPATALPPDQRRPFLMSVVRKVHAFAERRVEPRKKGPNGSFLGLPFVHWDLTKIEFELGPVASPHTTHSPTASR